MGKIKERIGLFGGTFNPPHMGHVNSMLTILNRLKLDRVVVIPNSKNPLKPITDGPTPEQRLVMTEKMVKTYEELSVDNLEVEKGGESYTYETIKKYSEKHSAEDIHLIVGIDTFDGFGRWKNFEEILTSCNLVVTSRSGHYLPLGIEELPQGVQDLVAEYDRQFIVLQTGRTIQFVQLDDMDVSATEIRKKLRFGKKVEEFLALEVVDYIKEEGLYKPIGPRLGDAEEFTCFCAQILFNRKGINVQGYNLGEQSSSSEFSLITSGTSTRHAIAMGEQIIERVLEKYGVRPLSVEGVTEGRWVLLDYGQLIVHIFYDYVRMEYQLENLWQDGERLKLEDKE